MVTYWVDWIIVLVLLYFFYRGWEVGLVYLIADLLALFASFWLALTFQAPVGMFLMEKFGVAASWRSIIGYVVVWVFSQLLLSELLHILARYQPIEIRKSFINRVAGGVLSTGNGFIIVTFFLLLIMALPVRGTIKADVQNSTIGNTLVSYARQYGGPITDFLDDTARQAVKFLTIAPGSKERLVLDIVKPEKLTVSAQTEQRMFVLVNDERSKRGLSKLELDTTITNVARLHSQDMFQKMYFSHINPEGQSAGERMIQGGVSFGVAGENLAYAPDVETAHNGLMESEGHRHNILDPQFHRIGIGVMDGGIWGQMYTQNFAD